MTETKMPQKTTQDMKEFLEELSSLMKKHSIEINIDYDYSRRNSCQDTPNGIGFEKLKDSHCFCKTDTVFSTSEDIDNILKDCKIIEELN